MIHRLDDKSSSERMGTAVVREERDPGRSSLFSGLSEPTGAQHPLPKESSTSGVAEAGAATISVSLLVGPPSSSRTPCVGRR